MNLIEGSRADGDFSSLDCSTRTIPVAHNWLGQYLSSFSEIFSLMPARPLQVVDVGTDDGSFLRNLVNEHPLCIGEAIGIDRCSSTRSRVNVSDNRIKYRYNQSFEDFATNSSEKFDLLFVNSTAISLREGTFVSTASRILNPGGAIVATFHWEGWMSGMFEAFSTEADRVKFLAPLAQSVPRVEVHNKWIIADLNSYPGANYKPVPAALVLFPDGIKSDQLNPACRVSATGFLRDRIRDLESIWPIEEGDRLTMVATKRTGEIFRIAQAVPQQDSWQYELMTGTIYKDSLSRLVPVMLRDLDFSTEKN